MSPRDPATKEDVFRVGLLGPRLPRHLRFGDTELGHVGPREAGPEPLTGACGSGDPGAGTIGLWVTTTRLCPRVSPGPFEW